VQRCSVLSCSGLGHLVPHAGSAGSAGSAATGSWPAPKHPSCAGSPRRRRDDRSRVGRPERAGHRAVPDGSDDPDRAADGTWLIDDDFLVLVSAWWESLDFVLPETRPQAGWQVEIDTYDPVSQAGPATAERKAGDHMTVGPRSVVVLKNPYSG